VPNLPAVVQNVSVDTADIPVEVLHVTAEVADLPDDTAQGAHEALLIEARGHAELARLPFAICGYESKYQEQFRCYARPPPNCP